jgi:hypothetical protein
VNLSFVSEAHVAMVTGADGQNMQMISESLDDLCMYVVERLKQHVQALEQGGDIEEGFA